MGHKKEKLLTEDNLFMCTLFVYIIYIHIYLYLLHVHICIIYYLRKLFSAKTQSCCRLTEATSNLSLKMIFKICLYICTFWGKKNFKGELTEKSITIRYKELMLLNCGVGEDS